ncbi:hypothetical protein [Nostoc sp.]|uniref:hypothetical protein n=1 Tax=Nostoc sp. TaxID=1180 RepID=UPI003FA5E3FF
MLVAVSEAMPQAYRLRSSSVLVLAIACSMAKAGIAVSIALSTSPLCISGYESNELGAIAPYLLVLTRLRKFYN